jgi:hypothetical protein
MPNYYNLSGRSTKVIYYSEAGGPLIAGTPPKRPSLEYISGSINVTVSGTDLTVSKLEIGTLVTALINKTGVPGAATYFSLLVPDVNLNGQSVAIQTLGFLTNTREVSNIGPGQRETYTEVALSGTAGNVATPL